jgi:hypothetical protein
MVGSRLEPMGMDNGEGCGARAKGRQEKSSFEWFLVAGSPPGGWYMYAHIQYNIGVLYSVLLLVYCTVFYIY